jgi:hypothetical protein
MKDLKSDKAAHQMFGDIAPKFTELSEGVLFGNVQESPQLPKLGPQPDQLYEAGDDSQNRAHAQRRHAPEEHGRTSSRDPASPITVQYVGRI